MKKTLNYLMVTAFLCALSMPIYTQNTIYLNARTIQTTADFDAQKTALPLDAEVFNNHFYRLVQFHTLPMPDDKAEMKQNGIDIMDYIPSQAFIMSFSKGFDFSFLSKYKPKTVIILRGPDKMSEALREGIFPDFAQKTIGKYDLIVQPYANVTLEQAAIDLQKRGVETIGLPNDFFQTITIRVKSLDKAD